MRLERSGDLANARELLSIAKTGDPQWLDAHAACFGLRGIDIMQRISWRIWLYRHPALFARWLKVERILEELRWRWVCASVCIRAHLRLLVRGAVGYLWSLPSESDKNASGGSMVLQWSSVDTERVEVHVGKPDGPLLGFEGPHGRVSAEGWVAEGTLFFLQDATKRDWGLTKRHTLAVLRVPRQQ